MRYQKWSEAYRGNLEWLPQNTVYLTRHGSHAYGTNVPGSDIDIRGICIAPARVQLGFLTPFEQAESKDPDLTVFALTKFVRLAADCNPNCLELLYTEPDDILQIDHCGVALREIRDLFLSRRAKHTFSGYALSQLKRIKRHYAWMKDPPKRAPTRAEFDLPEAPVIPKEQLETIQAAIRKKMDSWSWREMEHLEASLRQALHDEFERRLVEITQWKDVDEGTATAAIRHLGVDSNFLEILKVERQYSAAMKHWSGYQQWLANRNPARAAIEAKYGYDTKHGMHLVRLMRMAREILVSGRVLVRRPDAEELVSIRNGAWSYEYMVEWAEKQDAELEALYQTCTLPKVPDMNRLEHFVIHYNYDVVRREIP